MKEEQIINMKNENDELREELKEKKDLNLKFMEQNRSLVELLGDLMDLLRKK
jgi:hypothetical protein